MVGGANVLTSPESLLCYSYDAAPGLRSDPEVVVAPGSAGEVAAVLRLASQAGVKVVTRGAGTNVTGATVPVAGGIVLLMTRLNRILALDEANLTLTVEPGVITSVLHGYVEKRGLFYPPDPASASVCTIGGNIATGAGGLRALKYGVTRDYVLGLEAVLASGEALRTGGQTVKNVTGYDLTRLLVGSEGTLAVVTQAILRLIPLPRAKRTMLASFSSVEAAATCVSAIIAARILPCTLEFLDKATIDCVEAYAHPGLPREAAAVLLIEVDGNPAAVAEEAEQVARLCRERRALEVRLAQDAAQEQSLSLARRSAFPALARLRPTTVMEDATVPPSRLAELVAAIARLGEKYQLQVAAFGHAGDGNLHPFFLADGRDPEQASRLDAALAELVETSLRLGGTLSGEHGIGLAKARFMPLEVGPTALGVMRAIKKALDPQDLLNPGKVLPP
ncbi:MAG: FAD-binding protein [Chloroflexi bacterium]|nr:FAD-binding protein [Chloroflexota bacterium]